MKYVYTFRSYETSMWVNKSVSAGCAQFCFSPLPLQIQHTDDMENEIDELLQEFEDKSNRPFLHTVCFYW